MCHALFHTYKLFQFSFFQVDKPESWWFTYINGGKELDPVFEEMCL